MKKLRPLTVVPPELYVERSADRQVESIISNMGRPGYVLVARQMGKTNLLLNAKRKRDNTKEIFTYLDVSNPFPDARSFFRNIIDLILETAWGIPSYAKELIVLRRSEVPPRLTHIEHEWELRQILRSGADKLIICLDEIDALTRCEYSDHVFSFIRSVYFSGRSNFPELENLTYLLSGVAEPTDIIKNKDVSPFNIGEKIYLDDFTLEEVATFLIKADIQLNSEAIDRLYHWINGYPRMIWDVCSALEDHVRAGASIDVETVDSVVRTLYLSGVEAPPVDHIRRLAEETPDIRDALIEVHYGKSEGISDATRIKLYLAGISRFSSEGDVIEFKNAVLEQSLNESYLHGIAANIIKPSLDAAIDKIKLGQFYHGLEELFALEARASNNDLQLISYWRGRGRFELEHYKECTEDFEKATNGHDADVRAHSTLYLGVTYYRLQLFEKAAQSFSGWASLPIEQKIYASIWYAQCMTQQSKALEEAEKICRNIIASPSDLLNCRPWVRMPAEALTHSYLVIAEIQTRRRELDKARRSLEEAVPFATADLKVRIYLLLSQSSAESVRALWLKKAGQVIRDANDFREQVDGLGNSVSVSQLGEYVLREERRGLSTDLKLVFDRLFVANISGLSVGNLIRSLVEFCASRKSANASIELVERYIQEDIVEGIRRDDARQLMAVLIGASQQRAAKYWPVYLRAFEPDKRPYLAEIAALNSIALSGVVSVGRTNADSALEIIKREPADALTMTAREASSLEMLRRYLPAYLTLRKSPTPGDISAAKKLFSDLDSFSVFDLPGFGVEHSRLMQEGLTVAMQRSGSKPDLFRGMKFGRNDYVRVDYDGEHRVGKFKKFESDLLASKCKLIGAASREGR